MIHPKTRTQVLGVWLCFTALFAVAAGCSSPAATDLPGPAAESAAAPRAVGAQRKAQRSTAEAAPGPASPAPGSAADAPEASAPRPRAEAPWDRSRPAGSRPDSLPDHPLTLEECIRIAVAGNPDIGAGRFGVAAAKARLDEAAGERLPTLDAVGGYTHYLNNQILVPFRKPGDAVTFTNDIIAADLVAELPLFTGGRITSGIKAAKRLEEASKHRLARTRRELVFNVSSVFFGILAQKKVIEALRFSKKALEEHLRRVEDMMGQQKAARIDRLRTEVRLANIEQSLLEEKNVLSVQHRLLANLLGIGDREPPPEIEGALDEAAAVPDMKECLARAYAARADYLAARALVEARAREVDEALSQRRPSLSLQGFYGGRWAAGSTIEMEGAGDFEDVGSIGLVLGFPIFEGGRITARIRRKESELLAERQALRKIALKIHLDVESACLDVESARERIRATGKAVEQGREALKIEREKYALGRGSITDVLDSQAALLAVEVNHDRALAGFNVALAELRLAQGEE